jgi:hypothetical protein
MLGSLTGIRLPVLVGWFSEQTLADLIRRQTSMLDDIFGVGNYSIDATEDGDCIVRSQTIEAQFDYGSRERRIFLTIKALAVPTHISERHPIETWVSFLDKELPLTTSGPLSDHQIIEVLGFLEQLVKGIFADAETARNAAYYAWGYNSAYNDWASRSGCWREGPLDT